LEVERRCALGGLVETPRAFHRIFTRSGCKLPRARRRLPPASHAGAGEFRRSAAKTCGEMDVSGRPGFVLGLPGYRATGREAFREEGAQVVAAWLDYVRKRVEKDCPRRFREEATSIILAKMCATALTPRGVEQAASLVAMLLRKVMASLRKAESEQVGLHAEHFDGSARNEPPAPAEQRYLSLISRAARGPRERWVVARLREGWSIAQMADDSGVPVGKLNQIRDRLRDKLLRLAPSPPRRARSRKPEILGESGIRPDPYL
jgi:hypothetical protein